MNRLRDPVGFAANSPIAQQDDAGSTPPEAPNAIYARVANDGVRVYKSLRSAIVPGEQVTLRRYKYVGDTVVDNTTLVSHQNEKGDEIMVGPLAAA